MSRTSVPRALERVHLSRRPMLARNPVPLHQARSESDDRVRKRMGAVATGCPTYQPLRQHRSWTRSCCAKMRPHQQLREWALTAARAARRADGSSNRLQCRPRPQSAAARGGGGDRSRDRERAPRVPFASATRTAPTEHVPLPRCRSPGKPEAGCSS